MGVAHQACAASNGHQSLSTQQQTKLASWLGGQQAHLQGPTACWPVLAVGSHPQALQSVPPAADSTGASPHACSHLRQGSCRIGQAGRTGLAVIAQKMCMICLSGGMRKLPASTSRCRRATLPSRCMAVDVLMESMRWPTSRTMQKMVDVLQAETKEGVEASISATQGGSTSVQLLRLM